MPISSKVIVLEDNFDAVRNAVTGDQLMQIAKAGGFVVEGHAKINAGSGRPGLNRKTGALVNSISVSEGKKTNTLAEADIGTNIIYARIHELGGTISAVTAKALHWIDAATGEHRVAKSVQIPARPYLRPALDENEPDILKAVETELWQHFDKATS